MEKLITRLHLFHPSSTHILHMTMKVVDQVTAALAKGIIHTIQGNLITKKATVQIMKLNQHHIGALILVLTDKPDMEVIPII